MLQTKRPTSGTDRAIQQGDDQEANQDGKANDHDGRAFLFFHLLCSLFESEFPGQFAGLNAKSDHRCMGSLKPKEFAWVVASEVELLTKIWRPVGQGYSVVYSDITKLSKRAQGF
jgi:hypothetical protein